MHMIKVILSKTSRLALALLLIAMALAIRPVPVAYAAGSIIVTTTVDEFDTSPDCSLREAIQSANTDSDFGGCTRVGTAPYTIHVPAGTYVLDVEPTGGVDNANDDLDITRPVNIVGQEASNTIIDGNAYLRVIDVDPSAVVTITNMTITNGNDTFGLTPEGKITYHYTFFTLT